MAYIHMALSLVSLYDGRHYAVKKEQAGGLELTNPGNQFQICPQGHQNEIKDETIP